MGDEQEKEGSCKVDHRDVSDSVVDCICESRGIIENGETLAKHAIS